MRLISRYLVIFVGFVAFLSAMSMPALAGTVQCDGCSWEEMNSKATALADATADYDTPVYVVNVPADAVVKYTFIREWSLPDLENGIRGYRYTVAEAWPAEAKVVDIVHSLHVLAKTGTGISASTGLPPSVYDHMNRPSYDASMSQFIDMGPAGAVRRGLSVLNAVNPVKGFNPDAVTVIVTAHYPDGSTAVFHFNPKTGAWERQKGSERDSQGNIVPTTAQDFAGGSVREYNFSGAGSDQDLFNFLVRAEMLGVAITGQVSRRIIRCEYTPSGVVCRPI